MRKLLIADSSEPFSLALANSFCHDFEIELCHDGESALETLLSFRPDILVLNLQLPFKDGLTVLQEAAYLPEYILATTSFLSPYVERCAAVFGVSYTMVTPAVSALRLRVMDMVHQKGPPQQPGDLIGEATKHLHILNFQTHLDGYQQLRTAIPLFFKDPHQRLTKELYPIVAIQCGYKDYRSVEHSIRKAIDSAWKSRNRVVWAKYFPPDEFGEQSCPTNKEFISRIAQMLNV